MRLRRELHSPRCGSPSSAGPAALREGERLRPFPLPAVGGSPPHPQHVCAAARLPCILQTHTFVLGPMGCADAHLEMKGSRVAAHTSPGGRARAPRLRPGSPLSPDGRADAPRETGAPNAPDGALNSLHRDADLASKWWLQCCVQSKNEPVAQIWTALDSKPCEIASKLETSQR